MPHRWEVEEKERKEKEKEAKRLAKLQANAAKKGETLPESTPEPTVAAPVVEEEIKNISNNKIWSYVAGIAVLGLGLWAGEHAYVNSLINAKKHEYSGPVAQKELVLKDIYAKKETQKAGIEGYNQKILKNNQAADSINATYENNFQGSITNHEAYLQKKAVLDDLNNKIGILERTYQGKTGIDSLFNSPEVKK